MKLRPALERPEFDLGAAESPSPVTLVVLGIGVGLGRKWWLTIARIFLWVVVIVSSMLIVQDREEAMRFGDPRLQWQFAIVAIYMIFCIVFVGRVTKTRNE